MKKQNRQCDGCTKCCEGWLHGVAHGKPFYAGKPCHFLACNGCSIYPDRPKDPCVNFRCTWLSEEDTLPAWMKPELVNVIVQRLMYGPNKDKTYLYIMETGVKIDSVVLNWFVMHHMNTKTPIAIQVDRGWNYYGDAEFLKEIGGVV